MTQIPIKKPPWEHTLIPSHTGNCEPSLRYSKRAVFFVVEAEATRPVAVRMRQGHAPHGGRQWSHKIAGDVTGFWQSRVAIDDPHGGHDLSLIAGIGRF